VTDRIKLSKGLFLLCPTLYPNYRDRAFENYLNTLEKKKGQI